MPAAVPVPPLFLERMSGFLADEFPAFAEALEKPAFHGLRVNPLKVPTDHFETISPFSLGERIPWCPSAFRLDGEDRPGRHPYHRAGLYYLQDPSAMAPAELLAPQPGECVLDMTAAPGGKTTQMASSMQGQGLLVANEIKTKRINHLMVNVERWGAGNVVITNETPERLADHFGPAFDRVLVDAPCSGEGMFRKDVGARLDWSVEMILGCAARQTNILRVAGKLVRPGGCLIYSTCTFAPEENEGVIARFLDEHREFEVVPLPLSSGFMHGRPEWLGGADGNNSIQGAVRLFPHRVDGEGHFVCLLHRREGELQSGFAREYRTTLSGINKAIWRAFEQEHLTEALPSDRLQVFGDRLYLVPEELLDLGGLRVTLPGVWLGNLKKDRFEPAHPFALFLKPGGVMNVLELPSGSYQLDAYLRGDLVNSTGMPGWVLIQVNGWPLGWGKRVQDVIKNHYPRGWQIFS
jgi:NOL1/NOP2/sun family putative RNA methylase